MNLIVLIISLTTIASTTSAHAIHVDMEADRQATYAELHMASEVSQQSPPSPVFRILLTFTALLPLTSIIWTISISNPSSTFMT